MINGMYNMPIMQHTPMRNFGASEK